MPEDFSLSEYCKTMASLRSTLLFRKWMASSLRTAESFCFAALHDIMPRESVVFNVSAKDAMHEGGPRRATGIKQGSVVIPGLSDFLLLLLEPFFQRIGAGRGVHRSCLVLLQLRVVPTHPKVAVILRRILLGVTCWGISVRGWRLACFRSQWGRPRIGSRRPAEA